MWSEYAAGCANFSDTHLQGLFELHEQFHLWLRQVREELSGEALAQLQRCGRHLVRAFEEILVIIPRAP
ncbi:hypothetical protein HRbin16_00745 [bacterium HR16]|nr:hypothetical protein HRbin16_00745 [bacterium HR16]